MRPNPAALSLRALARLLGYPDPQLRAHLDELRSALRNEQQLGDVRLQELDVLMQTLATGEPLDVEAEYVQLFDRGRSTSLHLFEHVHGDSRDRGPAMIDLAQTYAQSGMYLADGELPDYLPVVLEFVSTQPQQEARAFLSEVAHLLQSLHSALHQRNSAYAAVLGALLDIAGEPVAVGQTAGKIFEEPLLDESWEEPAVFGGCPTPSPAHPGRPQPMHFVRNRPQAHGVTPGV